MKKKGFTIINVGPTFVNVFFSFNLFFKLNNKSISFMSFVFAISSTFISFPFIISRVFSKFIIELSVNVTFLLILSILRTVFFFFI
jgi:hypothetical protein